MKRSPLKPSTKPLLRRKPLSKVSDKRRRKGKTYAELRKKFLEEHPECEVCLKESKKAFYLGGSVKVNGATQVHHKGRRNGKWLLDTRHWLPVCAEHHQYIEGHGDWARMCGYILTPEQRRLLA